jgi:antitoxin MazE
MQIVKWGNSLAIRLPKGVVERLRLKEGDDVEVIVVGTRRSRPPSRLRRQTALARMRALKRPLPEGFRFDRDEANER